MDGPSRTTRPADLAALGLLCVLTPVVLLMAVGWTLMVPMDL